MPNETVSGKPLFYTFWAEALLDKDVKERPWVQVLLDPVTRHCYPISHGRPLKNEASYFHISPSDPDFAALNIDTESWVVPKITPLKRNIRRRREGVMAGDMAIRFAAWHKNIAKNPPFTAVYADEFSEAPALITPWIYGDERLIPVLPSELAACEFMAAAKQGHSLEPGTMVYDDRARRLIVNDKGVPSVSYWILAYSEYLWDEAMTTDARREWLRLCGQPKLETYVRSVIAGYIGNMSNFGVRRDATAQVIARGSLAQAVMEHLVIPPMEQPVVRDYIGQCVTPFLLV